MTEEAPTSRPVFISYGSADKALAEAACLALEQVGIRCWIAPRDVPPGEFYADAIVRGLNGAAIFLLVLTQAAIDSPHVLREVERASAKRLAIVAWRVSSVTLTPALEYFLSASHWLDASGSNFEHSLPKLIEAVRHLIAPAPPVDPGHRGGNAYPNGAGSARNWRRIGLVAALLVVIVAACLYVVAQKSSLFLSLARPSPAPASAPAMPALPAAPPNSVAVLPFADMSEKKDQEYFSDGLTEELIERLARIPDLAVPGRTSSFYFKGKQATIAQIAGMLGVSHVLEGSVRKSAGRLRVTVQLIRADTGYHLWSETYDRKLDDIFKIQDEISALVTKAMRVTLLPATADNANPNVDANDLYLQARFIYTQNTADSTRRTVELLNRALALDSGFARAWALLARAKSHQAWQPNESSPTESVTSIGEARAAAARAIELSPGNADGHVALARIYLFADNDIGKAREELDRAIGYEPRNADALMQRGNLVAQEGHIEEAAAVMRQALALDPLNSNVMTVLGDTCLELGDGICAERMARRVGELYPTNRFWASQLLNALMLQGKSREAYETGEHQAQDEYDHLWLKAYFLPEIGQQAEGDAALSRLEATDPKIMPPYSIAEVYAHRGDQDRAMDWLDRQYRLDPRLLEGLNSQPSFIGMRENARFNELLRKVNLPVLGPPKPPAH